MSFYCDLSVADKQHVHVPESGCAVGIDLGTTNSCVAVYNDHGVSIVSNDAGKRTTPSCVAFTPSGALIGEAAWRQAPFNPHNTIYNAKRFIGRNPQEESVIADKSRVPFKVVGVDGRIGFEVEDRGSPRTVLPEQVSALLLQQLRTQAEAFIGRPVDKAVITVPAYFTNQQRQATKDAGSIAGLQVVRVLSEPSAAAIAYGLSQPQEGPDEEKTVFVFDFGGGTFDVSILSIDSGVFEVKATAGDTHLGGQDIDGILATHLAEAFLRKWRKDIRSNPRAMHKLLLASERAKRTLSSSHHTYVEIDSLYEGIDFSHALTRARLDQLCMPLFRRAIATVDQVLRDSKLTVQDIDEIVLVGGSTRIPRLQEMLSEYFQGKKLHRGINPDEAVAYGAAVQAAILCGPAQPQALRDVLLVDTTPFSLGIESAGAMMSTIIPRFAFIPCERKQVFSTYSDNQTAVTIRVFEGESQSTRYNTLLGAFRLDGIPPAPRGIPQIEVCFRVNANGILEVSAVDLASGGRKNITVSNDTSSLSLAEIQRLQSITSGFVEEYTVEEVQEEEEEPEGAAPPPPPPPPPPSSSPSSGELQSTTCGELNLLLGAAPSQVTWESCGPGESKREDDVRHTTDDDDDGPVLLLGNPDHNSLTAGHGAAFPLETTSTVDCDLLLGDPTPGLVTWYPSGDPSEGPSESDNTHTTEQDGDGDWSGLPPILSDMFLCAMEPGEEQEELCRTPSAGSDLDEWTTINACDF